MAGVTAPTKALSNALGRNFAPISGAVPYSDCIYNYVLSAATNKVVTAPRGAKWAIITVSKATATDEVWVNPNGTAAIPGADVVDGTGSQCILNGPFVMNVEGLTSFGIIAAATPKVSIAWYIDGSGSAGMAPYVQPYS